MQVECYAGSRMRDGGTTNEDAFWISRQDGRVAALCDGAGHAQLCGGRTVRLFGEMVQSGTLEVDRFPAWTRWLKSVDASMTGGVQTTFVGVAAMDGRLVGAWSGDSRAYLVNERGCRILTERTSRRLGSGEAEPLPIHERLAARDVVLLMSDGAWTPLQPPAIQRLVMGLTTRHLSDVPGALLDMAGAKGRADDMTVVAMRIVSMAAPATT
ncbi:MAG: SpoIIE family protein phosphatase [Vicinamibacteraceae bacterium]